MVARKIVLALTLAPLFTSCKGQVPIDLSGSKWASKGDYCVDSLLFFSKGRYEEYYCEFDDYATGVYSFKGDTLVIVEYRLDSEVIADDPKLVPTYKWKYLFLEPTKMQKIYYEDLIDGGEDAGTSVVTWIYTRVE